MAGGWDDGKPPSQLTSRSLVKAYKTAMAGSNWPALDVARDHRSGVLDLLRYRGVVGLDVKRAYPVTLF